MEKMKKERVKEKVMCDKHNKPFANDGELSMAWLIPRGLSLEKYKSMTDKANVVELSVMELQEMGRGTMALRHFERETYCEIIPISYFF